MLYWMQPLQGRGSESYWEILDKKIGVGFMIVHTKSFGNTGMMAHKSKIIPSYLMPIFEIYVGLQTVQKFATLHTELISTQNCCLPHSVYITVPFPG